jgi:hypothetical protein
VGVFMSPYLLKFDIGVAERAWRRPLHQ